MRSADANTGVRQYKTRSLLVKPHRFRPRFSKSKSNTRLGSGEDKRYIVDGALKQNFSRI